MQEELKQSEEALLRKEFRSVEIQSDQQDSMYSFLGSLESFNQDDFKFAENFKHTMLHPGKQYDLEGLIKKMDKMIEVNLVLATLYNGVPIGPTIIEYSDPNNKRDSFKGVGILNNEGKLDNAPFTCIDGDGQGVSFSKMENGRPAPNSYFTVFYPKDSTIAVDSLTNKTDVSGWAGFINFINEQILPGYAILWEDGIVGIG
jgi:hypothetical protein